MGEKVSLLEKLFSKFVNILELIIVKWFHKKHRTIINLTTPNAEFFMN